MALFWVVPVATAVLILSKRWQRKNNKNIYDKKRIVSEQIQEGLDTIQEIKSYSNEDKYIDELNNKLDDYETNLTRGELMTGVLVNSAQSILKLGLASVIIFGAYLLTTGGVDLFKYFIFLIVGSRIYEPVGRSIQ